MTERAIYTLAGVLILIATELLRWLAQAPPELCTVLTSLGGMLMAGGPSLMRPPDQRGSARVGVMLVIGAVAAVLVLAVAWSGCGILGPTRVEAEHSITWQRRPGPTCYVRTLADGEVATETTAPTSCVPPPEFCQPGPGEPGYQVAP